MNEVDPAFALGTFAIAGSPPFVGLVFEEKVLALPALVPLMQRSGLCCDGNASLLGLLENWTQNFAAIHSAVKELKSGRHDAIWRHAVDVSLLQTLPPVNLPRQIFCTGANYFKHVVDLIVDQGPAANPGTADMTVEQLRAHAQALMQRQSESGMPYVFNKPVSAVTGPNDPVVVPAYAEQADWELELAVVIGKPAFNISRDEAMDYVAGYTIANDITNRDHIYRRDTMKALGTDWVSSKSCPTFLPLGPYFVPAAFIPDPTQLRITLKLNGETMQDATTDDMIFSIARQIEYLSSRVQLLPGDIICTGSPSGNGTHYGRFLQPGDVVEGSISGLGRQCNPVVGPAP